MFTLAHLSDPHLAPLPQPSWRELAGKRMTGYINWQRKRRFVHDAAVLAKIVGDMKSQAPDHIAVTGDIANIAIADEFTRGRHWLHGIGTAQGVTFVPGNHDIYVPEAEALARHAWGDFMCADGGLSGFPFLRRRGPIAIVGLSSGVPTAPFQATGWLGAKQLAALPAMLDALKDEKLFRVVLIHHPPVSNAAHHKRLIDAAEFLKVIATHGAELVLHGHDHAHMINWLDGPNGTRVPAVGVPSASAKFQTLPGADKDAAAYNLYRIDKASDSWTCELISRGIGDGGEVVEEKRFSLAPSP